MHGPKNVGSKTANGSKIVGLRFGDHETKDMLRVVGQQCCVHLHGKDMLGIVVQQFCFRAHGSYTIEHHSHSLQKKKNGTNLPETSGEFMTSYYMDVPSYSSQAAAKLAKTVKLKWRENHF